MDCVDYLIASECSPDPCDPLECGGVAEDADLSCKPGIDLFVYLYFSRVVDYTGICFVFFLNIG